MEVIKGYIMKNLFIKTVVFISIIFISSAAHIRAADEDIVIIPDNDPPYTEPIPEPASIFLLGSGLAAMAGIGLRKKR